MFVLNQKPLSLDVAFTHDGIQYPANWLRLALPEERAAIGITEEPDPVVVDQRFYWDQGIPKDHDQLVAQWTAQIKETAKTLLLPTDWMVVKAMETKTEVPANITTWRDKVRLASRLKRTALSETKDTEELAAYVTSADYSEWPSLPE